MKASADTFPEWPRWLTDLGISRRTLLRHPSQTIRALIALAPARIRRDARTILQQQVFDAEYYRDQYPDIEQVYLHPVVHYVRAGADEGRNPHPHFDTRFYLAQNPDVARASVNPLAHFARVGWREGRDPSPGLSMRLFLDRHPEAVCQDVCPIGAVAAEADTLRGARCHVLVDVSGWDRDTDALTDYLERISGPRALGAVATHLAAVVSLEHHVQLSHRQTRSTVESRPPVEALQAILTSAVEKREPVLLVMNAIEPSAELVQALAVELNGDPYFGFAHPRYSSDGQLLPVLADHHSVANPRLAVSDAALLPARYLLPEYISSCFLVRWEVAATVPIGGLPGGSIVNCLFDWLRRARRLGFRTVVSNRIAVSVPAAIKTASAELRPTSVSAGDEDATRARQSFTRLHDLSREPLIAATRGEPRRVLLDVRNLVRTVNGTAKAILGFCDGLQMFNPGWQIQMLARSDGAEHHDLQRRYPGWHVHTAEPSGAYAAAVRLSQPWQLSDLIDLHRLAAVNAYVMLDTIAWDVVYVATPELDIVWRAAGRYADGLVFISEFSRQRFLGRFCLHPDVQSTVCHLSTDPRDYVHQGVTDIGAPERYWLLVGNAFDHKVVQATLDVLTRAFPDQTIVALGTEAQSNAPVRALPSGSMGEAEMQALYAGASLVVFPSVYEGFGLPVINALAYGRTVVARASAVLEELAGLYRGPGRLVRFSTWSELVHAVSDEGLRKEPSLVPGTRRAERSHDWRAAGECLSSFINDLVDNATAVENSDRHSLAVALSALER